MFDVSRETSEIVSRETFQCSQLHDGSCAAFYEGRMKYLLIVNKSAGKGIGAAALQDIKTKMQQYGEVKDFLSSTPDDTKQVLKRNADWLDAVVFVGGDGTFREGIRMLDELSIDAPIGLVPMGTGNDFVKSLGVPQRLDEVLAVIKDGAVKNVHDCRLNDSTFLNVASVGLDAAIVERQKEIKKRIAGPLSYVVSTLVTIFKYKKVPQKLIIDGVDYGDAYMLIALANGKYYGGGMKIAPDASPFDETLQIIALKSMPKIFMLILFPLLYFGIHTRLNCFQTWRGHYVEVILSEESAINLDGDIERASQIKVSKNQQTRPKIYLSDSLKMQE